MVTRRPRDVGGAAPGHPVPEQVEVLVDAELGIVLRLARLAGGQPAEVTELVTLELGASAGPAQFEPPPGSLRPAGPPLPDARCHQAGRRFRGTYSRQAAGEAAKAARNFLRRMG